MTRPGTLGELRASGWESRPVKEEVRANALARIADGRPLVDGVIGYEDTVLPQLENALIAGHDVIFLGERGAVRTPTGLGEARHPSAPDVDSDERAVGDARHHEYAVTAPDRSLAEHRSGADDVRSVHTGHLPPTALTGARGPAIPWPKHQLVTTGASA